jgi:hypothetical protein
MASSGLPSISLFLDPMMNTWRYRLVTALFVLSPCALAEAPSNPYPVAGLVPYQRPANAPILAINRVLDTKQALHGVSSPFPESLKFLHDQGRWFNPFTRPGMTGPYDLRGWHMAPLPAADKK